MGERLTAESPGLKRFSLGSSSDQVRSIAIRCGEPVPRSTHPDTVSKNAELERRSPRSEGSRRSGETTASSSSRGLDPLRAMLLMHGLRADLQHFCDLGPRPPGAASTAHLVLLADIRCLP